MHAKNNFYSQTKIPKSNVLSERRVQKTSSCLCGWRLLSGMRFNNPRQEDLSVSTDPYFEMPAVFIESKCLEALMLSLACA